MPKRVVVDVARKTITVYIDEGGYKRLRELIAPKSISRELDDLIKKRIAELEGREYNPLESADYEELKREHSRLVREVEKLERHLKRRRVYDDLLKLAYDVDVKIRERDLSNIEEIAPKILDEWDGLKEDAHQFITLLETVRDKWEIERKLEEIRKRRVLK